MTDSFGVERSSYSILERTVFIKYKIEKKKKLPIPQESIHNERLCVVLDSDCQPNGRPLTKIGFTIRQKNNESLCHKSPTS